MTSFTSSGATPARSIAARPATSPKSGALKSRSVPPNFPMAVRTALKIDTPLIASSMMLSQHIQIGLVEGWLGLCQAFISLWGIEFKDSNQFVPQRAAERFQYTR